VAKHVANDEGLGILICGSGNGICMTANKHKNIRAALCWNAEMASLAKAHNNANILCMPGRYVTTLMAEEIVDAFLNTIFEGGRHQNRINKIDNE
jgi:ribose 5-phosphate isomerase B